ncbi:MAG TPA: alpha/beta hydrolase [Burkholderiales bacterium]|nr:alpha/beta hydrolase [Burkholderiales bacterium]
MSQASELHASLHVDFMIIAGHRLEYRWIRPHASLGAARPVLVFLHEGLGSTTQWKTFPDRVAEATGSAALVYSRLGYGRSDPIEGPRKVDYLEREALDILPLVLNHFEILEPILIGHSDGASIALVHAGARARPVRALVAMAPHVFVEDLSIRSIAEAKVAFETTDLRARMAKYHADAAATFWAWNDIWLHPDFRAWNIERYLASIECPVLLIQGLDDEYGTLAQIDAIERQVSGPVSKVLLPQCKHSPHKDQKEATLEAIAAFVKREGLAIRS